ncbi:MAG: hypothetical protein SCM11_02650 [Bacillota bacterium]|nr:hypothetical protein [Bacillota bacterium]
MHDMNFFSTLKRRRSGNKTFTTFIVLLLVVFVILNGLMIGAAYLKFTDINRDIESKQAYLDDPNTQEKVTEANKARADVDLTSQYLSILQQADSKLRQITLIDTELIDHIRSLTPTTTKINASFISGMVVNLSCVATVDTDPLDMYHAFLHDDRFIQATLSTVTMQITIIPPPEPTPSPEITDEEPEPDEELAGTEMRTYSFSITATLATGGEDE